MGDLRLRRWKIIKRHIIGKKILDVGCDPFDHNGSLRQYLDKDINYWGVDFRDSAIKKMSKLGINSIKCDLNKEILKVKDSFFDTIIISETLEHLKRPYEVIEQMYRVLKPKGVLILTVPNVGSFSNLFDPWRQGKFKEDLENKTEGFHHINAFGFQELSNIMKLAGFKIKYIEKICSNIYPIRLNFPDWKMFSIFADSNIIVGEK